MTMNFNIPPTLAAELRAESSKRGVTMTRAVQEGLRLWCDQPALDGLARPVHRLAVCQAVHTLWSTGVAPEQQVLLRRSSLQTTETGPVLAVPQAGSRATKSLPVTGALQTALRDLLLWGGLEGDDPPLVRKASGSTQAASVRTVYRMIAQARQVAALPTQPEESTGT